MSDTNGKVTCRRRCILFKTLGLFIGCVWNDYVKCQLQSALTVSQTTSNDYVERRVNDGLSGQTLDGQAGHTGVSKPESTTMFRTFINTVDQNTGIMTAFLILMMAPLVSSVAMDPLSMRFLYI